MWSSSTFRNNRLIRPFVRASRRRQQPSAALSFLAFTTVRYTDNHGNNHRNAWNCQSRRSLAGGAGTHKKQQAMKRQRSKQETHVESTTEEPSIHTDVETTSSQYEHQDQARTALINPTDSTSTPSSNFDITPTVATKLNLTWSTSEHSMSLEEQYSEWQNPQTTRYRKTHHDLLSSPTPEGIMSRDITSSLLDLKDLFDPKIHLPYAPQDWEKGYEPATPLSDDMMAQIGVIGKPITIAEYMKQALTHPQHGYYTNPPAPPSTLSDSQQEDKGYSNKSTLIGPHGDFVTAPEVSHVFGHCICLWFLTQWQQPPLNKPSKIQLVEFGPGRGTLMADILQLALTENLRDTFGQTIHTIHFIEASNHLREEQRRTLQETLGKMVEFEFVEDDDKEEEGHVKNDAKKEGNFGSDKLFIRVQWHYDFASFRRYNEKMSDKMPIFVLMQEFLDALPVHAFERTQEGWRERLIDVVSREDNPPNPNYTPLVPRLRQVLSPTVTPAVQLFFPSTNGYKGEEGGSASTIRSARSDGTPVGTVTEICPEAVFLIKDIAQIIQDQGGVALVIDYGQEGTGDTIRAFSNHQQVPLTSYPGQVDVTADVDFHVLKHCLDQKQDSSTIAANDHDKVCAFGPVAQGEFLVRMGASDMVIALIEQESTTIEQANSLTRALKYLVMPEHMGERYKVMAIGRKRDGIFAPPGLEK